MKEQHRAPVPAQGSMPSAFHVFTSPDILQTLSFFFFFYGGFVSWACVIKSLITGN